MNLRLKLFRCYLGDAAGDAALAGEAATEALGLAAGGGGGAGFAIFVDCDATASH